MRQIERAEIVQFLSNFSNRIYMLHNEKGRLKLSFRRPFSAKIFK
ncbi:hypothetical protein NEIFLAOT_00994 [Neisseria flavescens NRL30031/H210]|uniref:Uncharacterized protein n=1 Tax=Neisseria flavescens NRL30031/H210 TaxID=546264 RepID=C0EM30_NEIFL|nr:hypothetical protein NEIFLAOT_00994 [Neisseria flavescens NRL30031/H210]